MRIPCAEPIDLQTTIDEQLNIVIQGVSAIGRTCPDQLRQADPEVQCDLDNILLDAFLYLTNRVTAT